MIHDNDRLDRLLREDASQLLPDAGFTAGVIAAMPPRSMSASPASWLKPLLMLGSVALGSLLAFAFAPADANMAQGFLDLLYSHHLTPSAITTLATSGALLATAIVLATATD
jgi:hypothetical protein